MLAGRSNVLEGSEGFAPFRPKPLLHPQFFGLSRERERLISEVFLAAKPLLNAGDMAPKSRGMGPIPIPKSGLPKQPKLLI